MSSKKVVAKVVWGKLPVGAKATNVPGQRAFKAFRKIAPTKAKRADEVITVSPAARVEPTDHRVSHLIAPTATAAERKRIVDFFAKHAKPGKVTTFKLHARKAVKS